ncbi:MULTISPECIES: preprotein translocase subunit YajC [Streptococcus]|jgi:preprotein translocase subunit YajC|uniref:Preprotein translocase subunit YajC n=1 Tax=Streptococcus equinus TaxID=1335 RepID=A0A1G9MEE5_STREI|nr:MULTISPECIES: preprotein translocase subunit YajC [Streptococcus]KEY48823.1 preprotein translocase subunit YajC [Streptococcus equinus]KFN87015.1 preprotein translocase subunit YajC [Streptococcus equinus ATCC 33317]MCR5493193.1 preprotein translocase subunit YajC [Streptococcus sp.]MDO4886448.1 preprotein translocase subunit YajC [Streptococcus sp.]MEE0949974.1 preprotein translocase subunit YajC [Streptococcus equinus]
MPTLIMLIVMVALIWFMQRSQKKQAQNRQEQLKALQKGDEIVTIGGLYGIIDEVDVDNQKMVLDIDGVYLTFELGAVKRVVNKAQQEVVETAVVEEAAEEQAETTEDTAVESED